MTIVRPWSILEYSSHVKMVSKKNWCGTSVKQRLEQAGLLSGILSIAFLSLWQNIQDNPLVRRKASFWTVVSVHGWSASSEVAHCGENMCWSRIAHFMGRQRSWGQVLISPSRACSQWPHFLPLLQLVVTSWPLADHHACWRFHRLPNATQARDQALSTRAFGGHISTP